MYAIILDGQRVFPLYNDKQAALDVLTLINTHGLRGRNDYKLEQVA